MVRRAQIVSTVIEMLGMAAVVAGTALIYWPAALIVGGLGLVAIGYALAADSENA